MAKIVSIKLRLFLLTVLRSIVRLFSLHRRLSFIPASNVCEVSAEILVLGLQLTQGLNGNAF